MHSDDDNDNDIAGFSVESSVNHVRIPVDIPHETTDILILYRIKIKTSDISNMMFMGYGGRLFELLHWGDQKLYFDRSDGGAGRISISFSGYFDKWTTVGCYSRLSTATKEKAIYFDGVQKATSATVGTGLVNTTELRFGSSHASFPTTAEFGDIAIYHADSITKEQADIINEQFAKGVSPFELFPDKLLVYYRGSAARPVPSQLPHVEPAEVVGSLGVVPAPPTTRLMISNETRRKRKRRSSFFAVVGGLIQVTSTVILKNSIAAPVQKTVIIKNNLRQTIQKTIIAKLNIRDSVSKLVILKNNIHTALSAILRNDGFPILRNDGTEILRNDAGGLVQVTATIILKNNIRGAIQKTAVLKNNIASTVSKNVILRNNLAAAIQKPVILKNIIALAVQKTVIAKNSIDQAISKLVILKNNINSSLVSVQKTVILKNNIINAVSKLVIIKNNIAAPVQKAMILKHNVRISVQKLVDIKQNVRNTVQKSVILKNNIRNVVSKLIIFKHVIGDVVLSNQKLPFGNVAAQRKIGFGNVSADNHKKCSFGDVKG